jgi:hypothetical protein
MWSTISENNIRWLIFMCHGDMAPDIQATTDGSLDPLNATQTIDVDDGLDSYGGRRKRSRIHINLCTLIRKSDRKKCSEITITMSDSDLSATHLTSCIGTGRGTYALISISWLLDAVSEHILPTDLSRYTICML